MTEAFKFIAVTGTFAGAVFIVYLLYRLTRPRPPEPIEFIDGEMK